MFELKRVSIWESARGERNLGVACWSILKSLEVISLLGAEACCNTASIAASLACFKKAVLLTARRCQEGR